MLKLHRKIYLCFSYHPPKEKLFTKIGFIYVFEDSTYRFSLTKPKLNELGFQKH